LGGLPAACAWSGARLEPALPQERRQIHRPFEPFAQLFSYFHGEVLLTCFSKSSSRS
jgi:hypothetical protein